MSDPFLLPAFVSSAGSALQGVSSLGAGVANFFSQGANLEWQKQMQRESWERDDTAVQRRAKDMAAAGFNPLLAAGSAAGNAPVVHTDAPQIDPESVRGFGKGISEGANSVMNALTMSKNFAVKDAEIRNLEASARKTNVEANAVETLLPGNKKLQDADLTLKSEQAKSIAFDVRELKPAEVKLKTQEIANKIQEIKASQANVVNQQMLTALQRARDHNEQMLRAQGVSESNARLAAMAIELEILKQNRDVGRETVPGRIAGHYTDLMSKMGDPRTMAGMLAMPDVAKAIRRQITQGYKQ